MKARYLLSVAVRAVFASKRVAHAPLLLVWLAFLGAMVALGVKLDESFIKAPANASDFEELLEQIRTDLK